MGQDRNTQVFHNNSSCNYLPLLITSLSLSERQENQLGSDVGYSDSCYVSFNLQLFSLKHRICGIEQEFILST